MTGVITSMHCKGFLEMRLMFELPASFIPFLSSAIICICLPAFQGKIRLQTGEENMLAIQVNVCYILKHLEDRKALSVHIYNT